MSEFLINNTSDNNISGFDLNNLTEKQQALIDVLEASTQPDLKDLLKWTTYELSSYLFAEQVSFHIIDVCHKAGLTGAMFIQLGQKRTVGSNKPRWHFFTKREINDYKELSKLEAIIENYNDLIGESKENQDLADLQSTSLLPADSELTDKLSKQAKELEEFKKKEKEYKQQLAKLADENAQITKKKKAGNAVNLDSHKKVERPKRTKKKSLKTVDASDTSDTSDVPYQIDWNVDTLFDLLSQLRDKSVKAIDLADVVEQLDIFYDEVIKFDADTKKVFHLYLTGFCKWLLRFGANKSVKSYRYISKLADVKKHSKLGDTKIISSFMKLWKYYLYMCFRTHFKKRNTPVVSYKPGALHFRKDFLGFLSKDKRSALCQRWVKTWNGVLKDKKKKEEIAAKARAKAKAEKAAKAKAKNRVVGSDSGDDEDDEDDDILIDLTKYNPSKKGKPLQNKITIRRKLGENKVDDNDSKKVDDNDSKKVDGNDSKKVGVILQQNPKIILNEELTKKLPSDSWYAIETEEVDWLPQVFNWMFQQEILGHKSILCIHKHMPKTQKYIYNSHYKIFRHVSDPDKILGGVNDIKRFKKESDDLKRLDEIQKQYVIENDIKTRNEMAKKRVPVKVDDVDEVDEDDDMIMNEQSRKASDNSLSTKKTLPNDKSLSNIESLPIKKALSNDKSLSNINTDKKSKIITPLSSNINNIDNIKPKSGINDYTKVDFDAIPNKLELINSFGWNILWNKQPVFKKLNHFATQQNSKMTKTWLKIIAGNLKSKFDIFKKIVLSCQAGSKQLEANLIFQDILPTTDIQYLVKFIDKSHVDEIFNRYGQSIGFSNFRGEVLEPNSGKVLCMESDIAFIANYKPKVTIPAGTKKQVTLPTALKEVVKNKVGDQVNLYPEISNKTKDQVETMLLSLNPELKWSNRSTKIQLKRLYIKEVQKVKENKVDRSSDLKVDDSSMCIDCDHEDDNNNDNNGFQHDIDLVGVDNSQQHPDEVDLNFEVNTNIITNNTSLPLPSLNDNVVSSVAGGTKRNNVLITGKKDPPKKKTRLGSGFGAKKRQQITLQLNLKELQQKLKKIWKKHYIYSKKYLQSINVWNVSPSKCIFCHKPRQVTIKNKKYPNSTVKFADVGLNYSLYLFQEYNLLIKQTSKVCIPCWNNFLEQIEKVDWKSENISKCKDKIVETHKIAGTLLSSKIKWNILENEQKLYNNILDKLVYCVKHKKIITDFQCKSIVGLTVSQFVDFVSEMIQLIKQEALCWNGFKISYFELNEHLYMFNAFTKKGEVEIIESLAILLMKWKLNCSNKSLHVIVSRGINQINKKILKITSAIHLFSNKYLINTAEKLLQSTNKKYNELMKIDKNIGVILADGVRFNCYKCRSDYNLGYLIFDNKHLMSAYNTIGFVTTTGQYVGFLPENGLGSDGHHGDGYGMDFILLNNIDNILRIIKKNSKPFANDGTRIIFDRALRNGCHSYRYGMFNYATPCLQNGPKTTWQNNNSRINATCYRWMVERAYGNIGQVWAIFKAACSRLLPYCLSYFGKWLNLAGAISNKYNIGMPVFDKERLKQTDWMINKQANNNYNPYEVVYLKTVVDKFRYKRSLKDVWNEAKNIYELVANSPVWTLNVIRSRFFLTDEELILYGGGTYSFQNGLRYMVHSKMWIRVFYSTVEEYKNMIMIRGIKKKYTRSWEKTNKKDKKRGDWSFHNVILTVKNEADVNLYTNWDFSNTIRSLDTICDCIVGTRQVCADSHVTCALMYLQKWTKQETVDGTFKISKKYWKIYDINHWVGGVDNTDVLSKLPFRFALRKPAVLKQWNEEIKAQKKQQLKITRGDEVLSHLLDHPDNPDSKVVGQVLAVFDTAIVPPAKIVEQWVYLKRLIDKEKDDKRKLKLRYIENAFRHWVDTFKVDVRTKKGFVRAFQRYDEDTGRQIALGNRLFMGNNYSTLREYVKAFSSSCVVGCTPASNDQAVKKVLTDVVYNAVLCLSEIFNKTYSPARVFSFAVELSRFILISLCRTKTVVDVFSKLFSTKYVACNKRRKAKYVYQCSVGDVFPMEIALIHTIVDAARIGTRDVYNIGFQDLVYLKHKQVYSVVEISRLSDVNEYRSYGCVDAIMKNWHITPKLKYMMDMIKMFNQIGTINSISIDLSFAASLNTSTLTTVLDSLDLSTGLYKANRHLKQLKTVNSMLTELHDIKVPDNDKKVDDNDKKVDDNDKKDNNNNDNKIKPDFHNKKQVGFGNQGGYNNKNENQLDFGKQGGYNNTNKIGYNYVSNKQFKPQFISAAGIGYHGDAGSETESAMSDYSIFEAAQNVGDNFSCLVNDDKDDNKDEKKVDNDKKGDNKDEKKVGTDNENDNENNNENNQVVGKEKKDEKEDENDNGSNQVVGKGKKDEKKDENVENEDENDDYFEIN